MKESRILYKNTLLYCGAILVNIDRSFNALYWCNRQEMQKTDTVLLQSGETMDIYRNDSKNLICAIPV